MDGHPYLNNLFLPSNFSWYPNPLPVSNEEGETEASDTSVQIPTNFPVIMTNPTATNCDQQQPFVLTSNASDMFSGLFFDLDYF